MDRREFFGLVFLSGTSVFALNWNQWIWNQSEKFHDLIGFCTGLVLIRHQNNDGSLIRYEWNTVKNYKERSKHNG